ncbi:NlpC/P60 family protein [Marinifilum sp. RC60d5]|uniref:NlpC/P60 family protein n=1 Tax=Marinifilum sp. RC60d5 TaxID=3458414 RepID=UPI004035CA03
MRINSILIITNNDCRRAIVALCLLMCLGGLFSCGSKKIIHNTVNTDEPDVIALKEKYAEILDIDDNKIKNIRLYKNIDNWAAIKDSSLLKINSLNVSFVQYLYYFNFNTKLPGEIENLYKSRKTYLYRDCHFLETGDLVFFKRKSHATKEVGFYLDNKIFVAAEVRGDLNFYRLQDSISKFHVISNAKIVKDGE